MDKVKSFVVDDGVLRPSDGNGTIWVVRNSFIFFSLHYPLMVFPISVFPFPLPRLFRFPIVSPSLISSLLFSFLEYHR